MNLRRRQTSDVQRVEENRRSFCPSRFYSAGSHRTSWKKKNEQTCPNDELEFVYVADGKKSSPVFKSPARAPYTRPGNIARAYYKRRFLRHKH